MSALSKVAVLCLWLCLLVSVDARSQAFCALRDPVGSIYGIFPEAEDYRSVVKVVDNFARDVLHRELGFDLHFNEFGRHTVYVPMRGTGPLGIVHARSEGDRFGLTEIVWAFDLNLRLVDFQFQRSRNPARRELDKPEVRGAIVGLDYDGLREILENDSAGLRQQIAHSQRALDLLDTVLRSALKTILVTEQVWGSELRSLRVQRLLAAHIAEPILLDPVANPYTPAVESTLQHLLIGSGTGIDRASLAMHEVRSDDATTHGYLIAANWRSGQVQAHLQWLLDSEGGVIDVVSEDIGAANELVSSLEALRGFRALSTSDCANALELTALELSVLVRANR